MIQVSEREEKKTKVLEMRFSCFEEDFVFGNGKVFFVKKDLKEKFCVEKIFIICI